MVAITGIKQKSFSAPKSLQLQVLAADKRKGKHKTRRITRIILGSQMFFSCN